MLPKKKREKRKKKEDKEGKKKKKDDKTNNDDDDDDDDNDDDDNDGEDVTMTTHTTKGPTTRVKNTDVPMTPHTTKNPTTRVKNTVTTWTVSVAKESEATKTDEKKDKKSEKNKGLWQLPLGVAAGGLVLVLLLVGFLIRRSWARKAEVDRDRPPAVYAEISDVTQQPKDESCSSRSKEHSVYYLAGAPGTQEEVIGMKPIYHTIQDPNITTNLSNGENPYCLAQNPDVPKTSFD